jgi:hypothetical protein
MKSERNNDIPVLSDCNWQSTKRDAVKIPVVKIAGNCKSLATEKSETVKNKE